MGDCSACNGRSHTLCAVSADKTLTAIGRLGRRRRVARGETLICAGTENTVCANILSGFFKIDESTADGRAQTVGLLFPGDFLGRPYAFQSKHNVVALTDSLICIVSRDRFELDIEQYPEIEHLFLLRTLDEVDHLRQWILLLGRKTAEEKIASFLMYMAGRLMKAHDTLTSGTLNLPLSRAQIADILGLTTETVCRQMARLRLKGVIDIPARRSVRILDWRALTALSEHS